MTTDGPLDAGRFDARTDTLPVAQQRLWPQLRPSVELGLVLYGGTAIALRLGHRESVDFDFFTDRPLDRVGLNEAFPFLRRGTVLQDQQNSFTVEISEELAGKASVKLQFFGNIGIGRVGTPEATSDGVLMVASLDDLMATKTKVVLQRVESKDYTDIAAMVRAGVSLEKGLASAAQMYGPAFQPNESLKAMTYFEGGDLHLLGAEEKRTLIAAAKNVRELPRVSIILGLSSLRSLMEAPRTGERSNLR